VILILLVLLVAFIVQAHIAPTLLSGSLSIPVPQQCNMDSKGGTQWLFYDCLPNPLTGFGCVIPGTHGTGITKKKIAVKVTPCQPPSGSSTYSGTRVVKSLWQEVGTAGPCSNPPDYNTCCSYNNSECAQKVQFLCKATGQIDGENQCLPEYLPMPYPAFDPHTDYSNPANIITLYVPCRSNFCTSAT
jgi:hypothetical protein